ncbi:MAG TPA: MBL fold metallo-hydrolase [Rhodothermales bacterium]|nr:MBL fold metallo-hydrolase [Rhodothermales bacterium]
MIKPLQADERFLADVAGVRGEQGALSLWWLGQSGFLVHWQGRFLLFDPYLSDSLTEKYAATDKPHVRMTERVIAPERLDFIDVVTSSHNHTDHLDAQTLRPLLQVNKNLRLVIPEANRGFVAERLGIGPAVPVGLQDGGTVEVAGFRISAVPAAHEALDTDARGRHVYLGYVVQAGPWTIYHSGDTVRYDGMAERLRRWKIDVALLPINGAKPERRVAGNLDGWEAAGLAHDIGAKLVVPCHYEMFAFNTASPDAFAAACEELGQPCRVLRAGERVAMRNG